MFMLWLFISIVSVHHSCLEVDRLLHAFSPGDIIIGGLFPVHSGTNHTTLSGPISCDDYDSHIFLHTQVMIHAIREVNQQTPRVLPNFTLGYDIYDTRGDVSIAIRAALQLLKNQSDPQSCLVPANNQSAFSEPQTKVVIGERNSEVSIAVARIFALSSVAQISHASTSEVLSKKYKFPSFLRTVPSDEHQTKGIVELVKEFNWRTVAIVGSDDEYGKYGSDHLEEHFINENICVEFKEILPGNFNQNSPLLSKLVKNIKNSSAEAIILFTKDIYVRIIMNQAIASELNRTWIASDTWSTSSSISSTPNIEKAGQVFGFIFKRKEVPGFKDYVTSVFNVANNSFINHHLSHYPLCLNKSEENEEKNCSLTSNQQCLRPSCLATHMDQDESYSIYLAVQVIVEGLRRLLNCSNQQCERGPKFTALELLKEIQKVNFTVNTTHIFFNDRGDPSLGYDIVHWNMSKSTKGAQIETIGEYLPNGTIKVPENLRSSMSNVTVTVYNCCKTCEPGQEMKVQRGKCCYACVNCATGKFSPGNGMKCQDCGKNEYSPDGQRDKCITKADEYLCWSDHFSIILNSFAIFGIIASIGFTVLFAIYSTTPVVKAVGGYLCFLELLSLLASFCLTFSFMGKPTEASCFIGMPFFFVAFSVCISCILANLLQILVGFNFHLKLGSWIKKINQPVAVVTIISGVQLVLSVSWLIINPPTPIKQPLTKTILHQCEIKSQGFILAMIAYQTLLGFICFLFAFKGKQLPDLYKNAVLISVSMVLFLIIWAVFTPLYLTLTGKYKAAIESATILISSYSILGCHLAPKCYIIVFRKELNNENAISEYIRKHYEQKGISVVRS